MSVRGGLDDDPEFIAVYGEAFARSINTNFTNLQFGRSAPERPSRRGHLAPADLRWFDHPAPQLFINPLTGEIATPDTDQPARPSPTPVRVDNQTHPAATAKTPAAARVGAEESPYAARMAAMWATRQVIAIPKCAEQATAAPPATGPGSTSSITVGGRPVHLAPLADRRAQDDPP